MCSSRRDTGVWRDLVLRADPSPVPFLPLLVAGCPRRLKGWEGAQEELSPMFGVLTARLLPEPLLELSGTFQRLSSLSVTWF